LAGRSPFRWAGVGGKREKGLFWGVVVFWDLEFPTKSVQKPTLLPAPLLRRRLSSCEGVPTPKIALIREKTALLFWDIPDSKPVWQSGVILQQKITANSTYWEANLGLDGLGVGECGKKEVPKKRAPIITSNLAR